MPRLILSFILSLSVLTTVFSQDASSIFRDLEKLNFLGSMLYVAAHPDDENTALISYFSNHVHAHSAYLSLTRGDGGQNLIGTELKELLGVIRTNELLQARKQDGGHQFFTSAVDFGYSKHPKETLEIWNKKQLLGEVVERIRTFQPDLIIHRFDHRTPGKTHGHHTSSALLSYQAFDLSHDSTAYPDQLNRVAPWQVRRQFFNTSWWFFGGREQFEKADKSNFLALEIGQYDPILGRSNSSIAAASRSSHKSQGFGSSPRLGKRTEYIELINGDKPNSNDPFEGINTTWSRLKGGEKIGKLVEQTLKQFDFQSPSSSLPSLLKIFAQINTLEPSVWKTRKLKETYQLIKACAGLKLQLNAPRAYGVSGETLKLTLNSVQHSPYAVTIKTIDGKAVNQVLVPQKAFKRPVKISLGENLSSPYWLLDKSDLGTFNIKNKSLIGLPETPPLDVKVVLEIDGVELPYFIPVNYRITDPVRGEVITPFYIVPALGINFEKEIHLFQNDQKQNIRLEVTNYGEQYDGQLSLSIPKNWAIDIPRKNIRLFGRGSSEYIDFKISPKPEAQSGFVSPMVIDVQGQNEKVYSVKTIDYQHIPKQYVAQPSEAKLIRLDLKLPEKRIGYIMGAGDLVLANLQAIGLNLESIDIESMGQEELNQFDTVLVGIRAFNVLEALKYKNQLLFDFAQQGGTLIVQYNTSRGMKTKNIAPYPIQLSRDRVTNEDSDVRILEPQHPIMSEPHKITAADFEGWVQERGLYFADNWDPRFTPLLGMKDDGESEKFGSLLVANHGRGKVVYTGLSFFRELPAGVPGAYRLMLNLLAL